MANGLLVGIYEPTRFKSSDASPKLETATLLFSGEPGATASALAKARGYADGVTLTKCAARSGGEQGGGGRGRGEVVMMHGPPSDLLGGLQLTPAPDRRRAPGFWSRRRRTCATPPTWPRRPS